MQRSSSDQSATLVQRCIALFQLLPTSGHRWLIAADWLEEEGAEVDEVTSAAFREGTWVPAEMDTATTTSFIQEKPFTTVSRSIGMWAVSDTSGRGYGVGYGYGWHVGFQHGIGYGSGGGMGDGGDFGIGEGDGGGDGLGGGYGRGEGIYDEGDDLDVENTYL